MTHNIPTYVHTYVCMYVYTHCVFFFSFILHLWFLLKYFNFQCALHVQKRKERYRKKSLECITYGAVFGNHLQLAQPNILASE